MRKLTNDKIITLNSSKIRKERFELSAEGGSYLSSQLG